MERYARIIYWSGDDGKFIAEVPELPGCMADGETPEEALRNSSVIISEWIETAEIIGREIPEPSGKKICV
ncbi:MAG: type II toxin-antitoxin system HicB family antitoxin [Synergistaceae bacterium]|nr:type II toxin-antitoxin system HicB family antitoxin [Synergistaceae bacterium]MBQ7168282.1 type II toxin-antitoxin system HicB family antitoxin [Synergistaceae bacterium]